MGFWKVFAGAAVGVGAVAAAPFTGGASVAGAVRVLTTMSAAKAVAVGVGAGVDMVKKNAEKKYNRAREEGYQQAKTQYKLQIDKLQEQLTVMMADISKREQFIVTAFALGICCAYADGHVCNTEMDELDYLVAGIGRSDMLSETTKKQIIDMQMSPPNLSTVWAMIKKHRFDTEHHLQIFSTVVEMVVHADEMETPEERAFIERWNNLAA